MLSCTEISFVKSVFNFEKFWVKPGFSFTQLNRANTQNLKTSSFDMSYKNDCWSISHPLANMSDQCVIWKRNSCTIIPCYQFCDPLFLFFRDLKLNLGFLFSDSLYSTIASYYLLVTCNQLYCIIMFTFLTYVFMKNKALTGLLRI